MKVEFIKLQNICTEEVYYALPQGMSKNINGVDFIEVTPDFKRSLYIDKSSVKRVGMITKEIMND